MNEESKDIEEVCGYCQGRIDQIKQNHQDEEWLEEVVKAFEEDCIKSQEKDRLAFERKKANSLRPDLELIDPFFHNTNSGVGDAVGVKTCPDCKEYINSWSFQTISGRIIHKEGTHSCNNKNHQERERERILADFKKYNIKSIKLEGNKLIIKYNNSQIQTTDMNDTELQSIKSYLQKLGDKNELTLSDLEQSHIPSNSPGKGNKGIYIGLSVVGVLVVGVIAYFVVRKNRSSKNFNN